jgi:hypothetical protein
MSRIGDGLGGFWRDGRWSPGTTEESVLTSPEAPHETAAVLRMHRAGIPVPRICAILGISKQQLIHEMNAAVDDETHAGRAGLKIHDATVAPPTPGAKEKYAKDVVAGEFLVSHGAYIAEVYTSNVMVTLELSANERVRFAPYDKVQVAPREG